MKLTGAFRDYVNWHKNVKNKLKERVIKPRNTDIETIKLHVVKQRVLKQRIFKTCGSEVNQLERITANFIFERPCIFDK